MGTPANFKRPISEEDFQVILNELRKPPINVSFRPISIEEKPLGEALITHPPQLLPLIKI